MNTEMLLKKIGLTARESAIYISLLELQVATGYAIAKKTGFKRATAYLTLENLERQNLVHKTIRKRKLYYMPESPEVLLKGLNKKTELVKRALPELLQRFNTSAHKPTIELFEGSEGIKEAFDRLLSSSALKLYGSSKQALALYPEALQTFTDKVKRQNLVVQDILSPHPTEKEYINSFSNYPNYQIRTSAQESLPLSDFALSPNALYIFTYEPDTYCLYIQNKNIVGMFQGLFNLAWASAKQIEKSKI